MANHYRSRNGIVHNYVSLPVVLSSALVSSLLKVPSNSLCFLIFEPFLYDTEAGVPEFLYLDSTVYSISFCFSCFCSCYNYNTPHLQSHIRWVLTLGEFNSLLQLQYSLTKPKRNSGIFTIVMLCSQ